MATSDKDTAKIRWAPRLRPELLERLYRSDAQGFHDTELCDKVGTTLYCRCQTLLRVHRDEVECPLCGTVFRIARDQVSACPQEGCGWHTTGEAYAQSIRNHYASPGRALAAYALFCHKWETAAAYRVKLLLIDQLIHSFHLSEKGEPAKSVASKLLEGNKKAVVRFLDRLSARDSAEKEAWRCKVEQTIDAYIVRGAGSARPRAPDGADDPPQAEDSQRPSASPTTKGP
jgi:ribosomal protein L37AE/L43A